MIGRRMAKQMIKHLPAFVQPFSVMFLCGCPSNARTGKGACVLLPAAYCTNDTTEELLQGFEKLLYKLLLEYIGLYSHLC